VEWGGEYVPFQERRGSVQVLSKCLDSDIMLGIFGDSENED